MDTVGAKTYPITLGSITRGVEKGALPNTTGLASPRTAGADHSSDTGKGFLISLGNLVKGDEGFFHEKIELQRQISEGKKGPLSIVYGQISDALKTTPVRSGNSQVINITFNAEDKQLFLTPLGASGVEFKLDNETESVSCTMEDVATKLSSYGTLQLQQQDSSDEVSGGH